MSTGGQLPFSGMSTQVQDTKEGSNAVENYANAPTPQLSGGRLWLHRVGVLLFVFFCAIIGVILIIFPWRDEWANNSLLFGHPGLQDFLANGFVRGLCSGLGLLDIWIGFWEAVHYHE